MSKIWIFYFIISFKPSLTLFSRDIHQFVFLTWIHLCNLSFSDRAGFNYWLNVYFQLIYMKWKFQLGFFKPCGNFSSVYSDEIFAYNPAGMDASQMHLWNVSYSLSETSRRGLICKPLRRLPGDWLKTSPQRHLWDLSSFLRDVFELHLRDCNSWPSN